MGSVRRIGYGLESNEFDLSGGGLVDTGGDGVLNLAEDGRIGSVVGGDDRSGGTDGGCSLGLIAPTDKLIALIRDGGDGDAGLVGIGSATGHLTIVSHDGDDTVVVLEDSHEVLILMGHDGARVVGVIIIPFDKMPTGGRASRYLHTIPAVGHHTVGSIDECGSHETTQ